MRPWVALKASGLPFKQTKILLDRPDTKKKISRYSPTGKVPVLIDGSTVVWDSLAICEYIAELAPQLWPKSTRDRATARSYAAEMHSGFQDLRNQLSMDIQLRIKVNHLTTGTVQDIERILEMWKIALKKSKGPFLFGDFCIADAFFAPVVMRFESYGISIKDKTALKYMRAIQTHPAVKAWIAAGRKEKSYRPGF